MRVPRTERFTVCLLIVYNPAIPAVALADIIEDYAYLNISSIPKRTEEDRRREKPL
jgi:hypothetical protein